VLAKLRPAFRGTGTITAGNAPGLNSGGAAMIVADRTFAEAKSVKPMARLVAYGAAINHRAGGEAPHTGVIKCRLLTCHQMCSNYGDVS
jgi:acetyl-CoA acetyltransferase